MDSYKVLNRELSLKNQQLKQCVGSLNKEMIELNRILLMEREDRLRIKSSIMQIIKTTTDSFQKILNVFSDEIINDNVQLMNCETSENYLYNNRSLSLRSNSKNNSSNRCDMIEKENNSLVDISNVDSNSRFSYIQTRKRSKDKSSLLQLESASFNDLSNLEISNPNETEINRTEDVHVESQNYSNNEEIVEDFDSDEDLNKSNYLTTIAEEKSHDIESKQTIINCDESSLAVINETTYNNISMSKATSSTPYKSIKNRSTTGTKQLKVVLPRLSNEILKDYGLKTIDLSENKTEETTIKNRTTKENSNKFIKNETISQRPKRKAAPTDLQEPKLGTKLRRK